MSTLRDHVARHVPHTVSDKRAGTDSVRMGDAGRNSIDPGSRASAMTERVARINTALNSRGRRING
jgi:hypothetical protein